jgi:hypothetical protein
VSPGAAALHEETPTTTGKKCEAFLMTGDKILNLTPKSSLDPQVDSSRWKKQRSAPNVGSAVNDEPVKENGVQEEQKVTL